MLFAQLGKLYLKLVIFSEKKRFLLAGLQNGTMQFIYLPFKKVLTGQPLAQSSEDINIPTFTSAFISGDSDKVTMTLVTHNGQVFTFDNVELDFFHKALNAGDLDGLKAAQSRIKTGITNATPETVNGCVNVGDSYLLATGRGVSRLLLSEDELDTEGVEDYVELENCVKLVVSKSDPSTVFCLDKSGRLHGICSSTLVKFFTWAPNNKEVIEDFVLLEDEGSSEAKLMVLTKDCGKKESFFQIIEFPSFTTIYRLAVSWFSRLVVAPLNQDTPMLLEGALDDVLKPDLVTRMRIRGISEGVPEARLARLLKRNKFDEAEQVASSFALDKEQIYRAKSAWILDHLSPWRQEARLIPMLNF